MSVYERVIDAIRATFEQQKPDLIDTDIRINMAIDASGHPTTGSIKIRKRSGLVHPLNGVGLMKIN